MPLLHFSAARVAACFHFHVARELRSLRSWSSRARIHDRTSRERQPRQALVSTTAEQNSKRDEWSMLPTAFNQAKALRDFGAKPHVVITAGRGQLTGWPAVQDKLARLSSNSAHRTIAGAEHAALLDDQRFAADSSKVIHDVVTSVRTGAPVTP